jgi:hypothetical protein
MAALRSLLEACTPRQEVLSGELRDEMFAARLNDVVKGIAHPVYQDPEVFFRNTHPTERVRSFLREVLGRLSGKDKTASALFRLDTPFGGGKTHTLIALYHLATAKVSDAILQHLGIGRELLPAEPVKTATVVGDDLDPSNGVEKDGLRVYHLWGEMALQLGGREGYALVQRSDEQGAAPGPQFLEKLIGDRPTLILIDEPALYMRKMGEKAGQLPAFLKTLTEWVTTSASRTVLVFTLAWDPERQAPQSEDAFAKETRELVETLEGVFRETTSVVSRPAKVVTPAQERDIAPILRQRLFQQVDLGAAASTAEAYYEALAQAHGHGTPLPAAVVQASYREKLEQSYPFHPSFIEVLDGKLATIPNFQRTRGALRLLSRVVRRLWSQQPSNVALIHTFGVDLSDPDIVDELTGRLDRPGFRAVARYDIAREDGQSHAQLIDHERFSGHPPYTQRIATTLFLHSLPEPPARGADVDELLAAALTPDSDPAHLQKALQYLLDEAWHLDFEGRRYFFRTEASLNKIVLDETQGVPLHEARAEVTRRVRQLWKDAGLEVEYFPNDPSELEDEPKGRLSIIHWDTASFRQSEKGAPDHIRELWEYAGTQRGYRRFRNAVFFLVADTDRRERMIQLARRWLALDHLLRDMRKLDEYKLSKEHRQRLDEWRKTANLDARVAITRAYCHLFYPVGDSDSPYRPFAHHTLQIEDQGETRVNHTETILGILRELNKVKSADDAPLSPALVRQNAFGKDEGAVSVRALYERFAERVRLPLLLEPTYLKEIVRLGVRRKEWLYYDKKANLTYETEDGLPEIVVDEDHELVLPQEAKVRNLPIYWKKKPEEQEKEKEKVIRERPGPTPLITERAELQVEGEPKRALADLAALAKDAKWQGIESLELRWEGNGKDAQARLAALRTVLGQTPGAQASVEASLACEYQGAATWQSTFKGPASLYQSMAATVENMVGQAQDAHVAIGLSLAFTTSIQVGGPEYEDLREVLDLAGLGRIKALARRAQGERS